MKRVLPVLVLFSSLPLFAADKANADALNRWVVASGRSKARCSIPITAKP